MHIKIQNISLSLVLLAFASCVSGGKSFANSTQRQVFSQPVVFEDKIVFLKPVVFKSGVEFRAAVKGHGAPYYATPGASAQPLAAKTVRLRPVEPAAPPVVEEAPPRRERIPAVAGPRLSVLTYNVKMWSARQGRRRLPHVFKLLKEERPDVVALQECGTWFYRSLIRRGWFRENYYIARPDGRARHVGGLALFSRYPIESVEYRRLPRSKGRQRYVLLARIRAQDRLISVANLHLESPLEDGDLRRRQMESMLPLVERDPHTILLGDFNFGDGEREERVVKGRFADLWSELRAGDRGFTWNMEKSWMARHFAFRGEKSRRLDRILVRSPDWQPADVRLFGDRPIRRGRGHLFASDHFGVLGTLALAPHDA